MQRQLNQTLLFLILIVITACNSGADPENSGDPVSEAVLEVKAGGEGVSSLRQDQPEPLPNEAQVRLGTGEGVSIDGSGQATISLPETLTAELGGQGELFFDAYSAVEHSKTLGFRQFGGRLLADFNPNGNRDHLLTIQTRSGTISTSGGQFLLVHEDEDSLVWLVNLGEAGDILEITGAGVTKRVSPDAARWLSSDGAISDEIPVDARRLQGWYNSLQAGETELTLGEVLLSPANLVGTTGQLPALPRIGYAFDLAQGEQGSAKLTLDPVGLFGRPRYALEDCNGDGSQDIAIQAGKLQFDFRPVIARVLALDASVVNRTEAGNGALWGLDAAGSELERALLEAGAGESQTLSLRPGQPLHAAELALLDGCFVGFSLTPPGSGGTPGEFRVVVTPQPVDAVVNVLATPEQARPAEADQIVAWPAGPGSIQIDGRLDDWAELTGPSGPAWIPVEATTFDQACGSRFPGAAASADLAGEVRFAYDAGNLYVAFRVDDDGFVGYTGDDESYFLGDSPQLSLDVDLTGDFNDAGRSQDDWQVDFLPDGDSPRAALWQLGSLTSRPFTEAQVAVSSTTSGYLVEAALPWASFGISPQPGDRLGLAANVNDNDTPGSNAQECIISTAPQRVWDNPTTWGALFLSPGE
jgi:hypothetical protein